MKRFQSWSSLGLGLIIAIAVAAGCTRTISVVPTVPVSVTTFTPTSTITTAFTASPTPETMVLTAGTHNPTNTTVLPGASVIPVLEINANNSGGSNATITSISLTSSGGGNDATGINTVSLYIDTNNNGVVDGADTLIATGTYPSDNGVLTFNPTSNNVIPAGTSVNILVVDTFSPSASGTFQTQLANNTSIVGNEGTSPIVISGAPINGAIITVNPATSTITNTPPPGATNTFTPVNTNTNTPTNSPTITPTNTITNTPPPGATSTFTATSTPTLCTSVNFQSSYTFDANSIDCWQVNAGTTIITGLGTSSTTKHTGAGALQVSINNTSLTTNTAQVEVDYTVPQNFAGAAITLYVNVDAGLLDLNTYSTGIAVEDEDTGNTDYEANYTGIGGNSGTWIQIVRNTGIVNGTVIQLGIQLYNIPAGASGNLYIDDVSIALATATATPTITNTPPPGATATDTPTVTNTVTPTDTVSACPLPLAAPYTFDSSLGCWTTVNAFGTSSVVWTASPPAGSISGGGALQGNVTYPAGQDHEDFEVPLPANTDLTGKIVTFNVYIDGATGGTYAGLQPYVKETVSTVFCNAAWINAPSFNTWNTYQINLTNDCAANANDVRAIGIQIFVGGVTTPAAAHIYIDDVTITTALPPTATPTPNGLAWTYEDDTTQYWNVVAGTSGTGDTEAVTNITVLNAGATGTNGSTYGLDINFPALPGGIDNSDNDFQVECANTAGGPIIPAGGLNWSTLNITSVSIQYWYSNTITNYNCILYPYVRAGGGTNSYGGTYTGWPGQCNGSCNYQAYNTWITTTFTPSGVNWSTDMTNVVAVGADINFSQTSPNPFAGCDVVIDNITLQ